MTEDEKRRLYDAETRILLLRTEVDDLRDRLREAVEHIESVEVAQSNPTGEWLPKWENRQ
jgi:hypothetical protein